MAYRWREMDEETRNIILNDVNNEINHFRGIANEAFNRKSKLLTAGNAGGIITLITFIGTIEIGLGNYVLFSFLFFILGLIFNGIAIYLAESRFNNYLNGLLDARTNFMKDNSDITDDDYNEEIRNLEESTKCENNLELLSGFTFLIGVMLVFLAILN